MVCCGATAFATLLESCSPYKKIWVAEEKKGKITIKKTDLGSDKFAVVKSNSGNLPADIYLTQLPDGNFSALLMLCTHKQCDVKPLGNKLDCPCHGSEFSNTGVVLKGPASKPLVNYIVTVDDSNIYIYLK